MYLFNIFLLKFFLTGFAKIQIDGPNDRGLADFRP